MSSFIVIIIKPVSHRLKKLLISIRRARYSKHAFNGPLLFDIHFFMDFADSAIFA
jgi:hypothetical protein